jgi:pimeloyl-ACP methyl ester carboxylesterase
MTTSELERRDESVVVGDGRLSIHFKVAGNGPSLIYFHPLGGLKWNPLLDQLAEEYTVYAPEHPGTSAGEPKVIYDVETFTELLFYYQEAIDGLGLDRPAVMGQSFGGMVAADLAATFPELFSKLVLIAPLGLWRDDAPIPLVEYIANPDERGKFLFLDPSSERAQQALAEPEDPAEIPAFVARQRWSIGCTSKFAWPIADHGLRRRLHRIAVPTLLLWGQDDALVPVIYSEDFGSAIAGSKVTILEQAGHEIQVDQPGATPRAILEFLR